MNDDDTLCSIGELARRTGLTVKTIRFYSDRGLVEPTDRTPAGYRRYGADAVARVELVRTLRDLGLDLDTIRGVVTREVSLAEVTAAHAEALDVQIRDLRLRRAVLTAVSGRDSTPADLELAHRLAKLSGAERRRLVDDFLAAVFDGLHGHPAFAGVMRSMTPELPRDPSPEQIVAWVELAELFRDPDFCSSMHGMAHDLAADRAPDDAFGLPRILAEAVRARVAPALAAGIDPASAAARPIVDDLTAHYARILGEGPDTPAAHACASPHPQSRTQSRAQSRTQSRPQGALRSRLQSRLETMNDPRRDRYLELLAVVNGWPPPDRLAPALDWTLAALRAR
ncbi:MerR family transcriptional regulator [Streptomyces sp. p1417]|uniref:MerR family transcriptional regulator n=1 Tax=Streptomyces typhae TaxID=2681492 RepID=A0A6L6X6R5_9ACTN|nr:MerR family transcriptional regulator [Streptomyces typhae]MVO89421.1 MerR family transcriptional regulator [Streptomyces typhae]